MVIRSCGHKIIFRAALFGVLFLSFFIVFLISFLKAFACLSLLFAFFTIKETFSYLGRSEYTIENNCITIKKGFISRKKIINQILNIVEYDIIENQSIIDRFFSITQIEIISKKATTNFVVSDEYIYFKDIDNKDMETFISTLKNLFNNNLRKEFINK
ncbi:MAG: PH domain-containing protein [Rickettsiales bacterium]|jgi:uncharacterized membrane protein YdbT with pleckstrin-like domain|nr:PH domain-containing protein [Rickettsiales bacterium]